MAKPTGTSKLLRDCHGTLFAPSPSTQPTRPLGCQATRQPPHVLAAPRAAKTPVWQPRCPIPKNTAAKPLMALDRFPQTTLPNPRRRRPNGPVLPNRRFCCTQSTHSCARVEPAVPPQHFSTESARPHSADGRSSSRKHPRWGPAPCRDVTCTGSGASRRSRSAGAARGCGGGLQ